MHGKKRQHENGETKKPSIYNPRCPYCRHPITCYIGTVYEDHRNNHGYQCLECAEVFNIEEEVD